MSAFTLDVHVTRQKPFSSGIFTSPFINFSGDREFLKKNSLTIGSTTRLPIDAVCCAITSLLPQGWNSRLSAAFELTSECSKISSLERQTRTDLRISVHLHIFSWFPLPTSLSAIWLVSQVFAVFAEISSDAPIQTLQQRRDLHLVFNVIPNELETTQAKARMILDHICGERFKECSQCVGKLLNNRSRPLPHPWDGHVPTSGSGQLRRAATLRIDVCECGERSFIRRRPHAAKERTSTFCQWRTSLRSTASSYSVTPGEVCSRR